MNNCLIVTYTTNGIKAIQTQTSSTENSAIAGIQTFIEGTIGYEMFKKYIKSE